MNGNLSPLLTKIQPVENAKWEENNTTDQHNFMCLKGELIKSTIWVRKVNHTHGDRQCSIIIRGHFPVLNEKIGEACNYATTSREGNLVNAFDSNFTFHRSDERSEKFLDCINLIDKQCPLGKAALSTIWKCVAGYSTEDNARVDFLPLFVFFMGIMAMKNDSPFPNEITIIICQSFVQSTGLEFAKDSTDQFRKDFIANALQPKLDIKNIAPSSSVTSNDCLTL